MSADEHMYNLYHLSVHFIVKYVILFTHGRSHSPSGYNYAILLSVNAVVISAGLVLFAADICERKMIFKTQCVWSPPVNTSGEC